ncbi:MAG: hypothetical protein ACI825_001870, partial [Planctomycetota bacterium]
PCLFLNYSSLLYLRKTCKIDPLKEFYTKKIYNYGI